MTQPTHNVIDLTGFPCIKSIVDCKGCVFLFIDENEAKARLRAVLDRWHVDDWVEGARYERLLNDLVGCLNAPSLPPS